MYSACSAFLLSRCSPTTVVTDMARRTSGLRMRSSRAIFFSARVPTPLRRGVVSGGEATTPTCRGVSTLGVEAAPPMMAWGAAVKVLA